MSQTKAKGLRILPLLLALLLAVSLAFSALTLKSKQALEQENAGLQGQVDALRIEAGNREKEAARLAGDAEAAQQELAALTGEMETARAEIDRLTGEQQAALLEVERLTSQAEADQASIERIAANAESAGLRASAFSNQLDSARTEISTLKSQAETRQAENDRLLAQLKELEAALMKAEAQTAAMQAEIDALKAALETAESELTRISGEAAAIAQAEADRLAAEAAAAEKAAAEKAAQAAAALEAEAAASAVASPAEGAAITLLNFRVELDPAFQEFAKRYNASHPGVTLAVETVMAGADYDEALETMRNEGRMPTLFMLDNPDSFGRWRDFILDQSAAGWVADTDYAYYSEDGRAKGFPLAIEGFGLAYNADILLQAGIDPAGLTTFSAVKAAFEYLDQHKGRLGLDSVVSLSASAAGGMWWVPGMHVFNAFYAGYQDARDSSFYDSLRRGEVDQERLAAFTGYLKLLYDYADPAVLVDGNYDDQVSAFATGRAAFIPQGNWIDPSLQMLGATFKAGFLSHNFLEEESTGLYIAAPVWLAVNAQASPGQQKAAMDFLNHLALSQEGADFLVNQAGLVPAFRSVSLKPQGALSRALMEAVARGGNFNWYFQRNPEGFNQSMLGPIFDFFAKDRDTASFITQITHVFKGIAVP